ncbi:MAG: Uma2 family endonuclease [Chromatiaceae bacterium]
MTSPEALPRMPPEQYLAYEQEQPIRHELVDGYLYAMTGATDRHEEIALNLAAMLRSQLRGSPCRVYKGDLKIRVTDDFYYPDVFVRCGGERGDPYFKTDPVVIAEILSPATQRYDRGDKRLAYFSLPTLQEYVLIAQDRMQVEVYRRNAPEPPERLHRPTDVLRLESVDCSFALSELYE